MQHQHLSRHFEFSREIFYDTIEQQKRVWKRIRLHLNGTHSSRMELPNGILPNFIVTGKQPLFSTQQMSLDNKLSSKVLELCKIFNLLSIHLHQHMQGKNMLTNSSNLATLLYQFCKVEENSSLSSKEATYQKSCGFQAGLQCSVCFPLPTHLIKGLQIVQLAAAG